MPNPTSETEAYRELIKAYLMMIRESIDAVLGLTELHHAASTDAAFAERRMKKPIEEEARD